VNLGLVSDVHLRSGHETAVETALAGVVDRFDDRGVDRILVLGDLIEDESERADRAHVRAVRDTLAAADAPVTYLLGNHDVERLSHADLREVLGVERFWGRVEGGDADLFYLDSSAPERSGAQGAVGERQVAWLDRELADAAGAVVFVHHPLGYRDLSGNAWFANEPERAFCGNKREVNDVLSRHDVRAVVNGHVHETAHVRYRGVDHVTVSAFSKELPDVPVTGTYARVTVDGGVAVRVVEGDRTATTFEVPPGAGGETPGPSG
jgi:Icc protein